MYDFTLLTIYVVLVMTFILRKCVSCGTSKQHEVWENIHQGLVVIASIAALMVPSFSKDVQFIPMNILSVPVLLGITMFGCKGCSTHELNWTSLFEGIVRPDLIYASSESKSFAIYFIVMNYMCFALVGVPFTYHMFRGMKEHFNKVKNE